ncbi:hypothetical protein CANCADRAFT_45225 [Tortispora caseinolytica NRRL Y-17796]|uniref:Zn(2)-C6 fungal-type domain-containing protein n=1 Tax=Tortispora caseinolytica NRRL Y-17796 TaxID=767744 RepID=A0A1E4TAG4_9ASCO|nr:hypothetical protein CANCADRAFT_45225 [Tortispora caseinolytica NRRL Y-17796]
MDATASARLRRRHRVPSACRLCRMRKLKCDKTRPVCGTCKTAGAESACVYERQPWELDLGEIKDLVAENQRLKRLLSDSGHTTQLNGQPPTSGSANGVVLRSPGIFAIKNSRVLYLGITSCKGLIYYDRFIQRPVNRAFGSFKTSLLDFLDPDESTDTFPDSAVRYFKSHLPSPLHLMGSASSHDVLTTIMKCFPTSTVSNLLIDRFFIAVYPLIPLLDEISFRRRSSATLDIVSSFSSAAKRLHSDDFGFVALYFLVLRLGRLSLPFDWTPEMGVGTDTLPHTYSNMKATAVGLGTEYLFAARCCLSAYDFLRKSEITTVQCLLLLWFDMRASPEEGDGADGSDGAVIFGLAVEISRSIGIDQEPAPQFKISPNVIYLWRKIFYYMYYYDSVLALNLGRQPCFTPGTYSVILPSPDPANVPVSFKDNRLRQELEILKFMNVQYSATAIKRQAIQDLLRIDVRPSREQLWAHYQNTARFIDSELMPELKSAMEDKSTSSDACYSRLSTLYSNILSVQAAIFHILLLSFDDVDPDKCLEDYMFNDCIHTGSITATKTLEYVSSMFARKSLHVWLLVPIHTHNVMHALFLSSSLLLRACAEWVISFNESESLNRLVSAWDHTMGDFSIYSQHYYAIYRLYEPLNNLLSEIKGLLNPMKSNTSLKAPLASSEVLGGSDDILSNPDILDPEYPQFVESNDLDWLLNFEF